MPEKGTIGIKVVADLSDVRKKIGGLGRAPFKLKLDDKAFSQPLGRITGKLGEFDKSLEASNARVIAFGASAGAIYAIEKALKSTVSAAINVEKQLADINVILNASTKNLAQFGDKLFQIAATTGQSFQTVATAATELARQGLSVNETLKRTSDALVLTRLSGLSAVNSVESLTAAINSFNKTALTSTEIVNKLANVDAAFAVSSADLAEALRRVGSTAADAGVSFDQLVAAVTSAQQTTARGGSVIGNSFKTIFTRLQRPAVLNQLEQLGIKTKTLGDETRPVISILSDLAKVYDKLGSSQRSQISELIGGVFQINIVKAALSDLGKEYSFYDRALKTSASSTNEAIKRNEELNKTLSALINKTFANLEKVGSRVGEGAFGPAIKTVLGAVNSALDTQDTEKGAKDFGSKMAEGIFKGLGDFLSGPGLIIGGALLIKLFGRLSVTLADAFKTINTNNKATQVRIKLEEQAFNWLAKHPDLLAKIVGGTMSIKEAQKQVVDSIKMSTTALNVQYTAVQKVVSAIMLGGKVSMETGLGAGKIYSGSLKAGGGLIPTRKERDGEKSLAAAYGYSAGGVMAENIEGVGRVVYNSREKKVKFPGMSTEAIIPPKQSKAGKTYKKEFKNKHGFDPYSASENMAGGYVPNFAGSLRFTRPKKDEYDVSGNVGDILGLHTNAHQGVGSPFWKQMLKSYPDPKSKGKRGRRNSLLEKDDRVTTRVKIGYTRKTDSWREQENEARLITGSKNPAKGYDRKLLKTESGYKLPGKFYPTDMASGTYNGFKFERGDSKRYVDKFAGALTNPNHFYKSTIGKNLRAALMEKTAGTWLKEGKPGAGSRDEIKLGKYLLMTDSTTQLPTGERMKLKGGPTAKHPSGYFQRQHGIAASEMSRAGGVIPNFARYVFDKDAYLQKYADKGLLQSRLDETGARNIAELFDHDVMQAGKKGRLTLINAPPGAGKTSLAVGKTGKGKIAFDAGGIKGGDHSVVVRASQAISSGPKSIMNRSYAPFVDKFISLLPDSEAIRSGRESRNKSGKFMFGRGKKQTSGATTDFDAAAAVLHSAVPFGKHKGLGRGASGGWNMMSGSNFPAAHTVPVATTRGAFSPFTKGHQSVVDQMRKTGMPMSINVSGGVDREADIGWSTRRKRDLIKQTNPDAFVFSSKVPPETFTAPADMTVRVGNKNIKIKKGDAINTATEGSKMFLGSDRAQQSKTGKSGLFDITEVNRTGADISATKVRQAIAAGDRSAYSSMLGGPTTKFVDENIGDIQKMQGMIRKRNTKKLSGVNSRLSQLWSEMGIPFDPNSRSPILSAKRKKEFPEQTSEIQRLNSRKKGLGSHKWTKRIFPNLAGGHVPNFASKSDAAIVQMMTQRLFGPKPSVSGFNNKTWMGLLNRPENRGLLDRYNSLKVESLERAGATTDRANAITKELVSGKKVNTLFLENRAEPFASRTQPNIMRYGFDPAIIPNVERTFNTSLDTRWEKLIKGVAFDSFSKIPHKQLSKMGGMKSLMGGLTTRGLSGSAATRIALGPVRGRVFEELLSAMSTRVNKNIPETGTEGLDFANRKFKSKYRRLFSQGPAITGLGGQGMEIRSGGISNPHAMRKAGFAAGGALGEAISRETAAGVPRSAIRIGASSSLASGLNPAGLGVYNTIHEPGGLSQGINMHRASGLDPRKAGIPNFAGISGRTMAGMTESKRAISPDITDEVVDDFLASTKEATSGMQKWQSRALQASFIFPMVSGQLQSMVGTGTKASKYMESFSNGIGVASSFFAIGGSFGLVVGGAVGAFTILDGALTTASSNVLELSKKADESKEQLTKAGNALSAYGDGLQRYQEALRTGDAELTVRLQQNLNKQLAEVPAAFRAQVLAAKDATDLQNKLADSLKEMAKKNAQTQFAASLEKTVTGERTGFANKARRSGLGFGAGKGGEWFDVDVFEEIPGAAKKFASELRGTLNFQKLSKDLKDIDFELGNKDILIERITRAGAGAEVVEGIKDLSADDIRRLSTEVSELALQQQLATEQVQAHKEITEKYSKSVENAARTVKLLEERFKTFITNGNKAAQMLNDQITASDKLREQVRSSRRGDKLGDAERSLATRRPFMTEENIAISEARIKRRKSLDDRNASVLNADIEGTSAKRGAIASLRTDLLKVLEAKAARQGGKKDPDTGAFIPVMSPEEAKKVSTFFQQTNAFISGLGPIVSDPFGGRGGVAGPSDTATNLVRGLPQDLRREMMGKRDSAQLDILKANQTQNQKLDLIAEQQKQSRITEEKQLEAQLNQISIQKDIASAGGMEGFASGQGLDQALDKFSTGMVGIIAGRKRGSLSIAGRGAAMVEGSIQEVTGRPSGNMQLRNLAAAGRAENLNWGMGLMRSGLGSMGFGSAAGNLNAGRANIMAQNQADAFFKTGKPITPEGDRADGGLSLKLQQHGLKSAFSREGYLKGILNVLSNPERVMEATQEAKRQQAELESNRGGEIDKVLKKIEGTFDSFKNFINQQRSDTGGQLSTLDRLLAWVMRASPGPPNEFVPEPPPRSANGYLPNFAGSRRGEKRSVMDSSQYSPTEKSRAIPNRKMVNGQMTYTNHLEKIKNNYGGSGQSAVLTPAMMRGGFANGYVPNFALEGLGEELRNNSPVDFDGFLNGKASVQEENVRRIPKFKGLVEKYKKGFKSDTAQPIQFFINKGYTGRPSQANTSEIFEHTEKFIEELTGKKYNLTIDDKAFIKIVSSNDSHHKMYSKIGARVIMGENNLIPKDHPNWKLLDRLSPHEVQKMDFDSSYRTRSPHSREIQEEMFRNNILRKRREEALKSEAKVKAKTAAEDISKLSSKGNITNPNSSQLDDLYKVHGDAHKAVDVTKTTKSGSFVGMNKYQETSADIMKHAIKNGFLDDLEAAGSRQNITQLEHGKNSRALASDVKGQTAFDELWKEKFGSKGVKPGPGLRDLYAQLESWNTNPPKNAEAVLQYGARNQSVSAKVKAKAVSEAIITQHEEEVIADEKARKLKAETAAKKAAYAAGHREIQNPARFQADPPRVLPTTAAALAREIAPAGGLPEILTKEQLATYGDPKSPLYNPEYLEDMRTDARHAADKVSKLKTLEKPTPTVRIKFEDLKGGDPKVDPRKPWMHPDDVAAGLGDTLDEGSKIPPTSDKINTTSRAGEPYTSPVHPDDAAKAASDAAKGVPDNPKIWNPRRWWPGSKTRKKYIQELQAKKDAKDEAKRKAKSNKNLAKDIDDLEKLKPTGPEVGKHSPGLNKKTGGLKIDDIKGNVGGTLPGAKPSMIPDPFDAAKKFTKGTGKLLSFVGEAADISKGNITNPSWDPFRNRSHYFMDAADEGYNAAKNVESLADASKAGNWLSKLSKSAPKTAKALGYTKGALKFGGKWLSGAGEVQMVHEAAASSGTYVEAMQEIYGITIGKEIMGGLGRQFDVGSHTAEEENELFNKSLNLKSEKLGHSFADQVMAPSRNMNKVFPLQDKLSHSKWKSPTVIRNKEDRDFFNKYSKKLIETRKNDDDIAAWDAAGDTGAFGIPVPSLERLKGTVGTPMSNGLTRRPNSSKLNKDWLYNDSNRARFERIRWQLNHPDGTPPEDKTHGFYKDHVKHSRDSDDSSVKHKLDMIALDAQMEKDAKKRDWMIGLGVSTWRLTDVEMNMPKSVLQKKFHSGNLGYMIEESHHTKVPSHAEWLKWGPGGKPKDEFDSGIHNKPNYPVDTPQAYQGFGLEGSPKDIIEQGKTELINKIGGEAYANNFNEDGSPKAWSPKPIDKKTLARNQKAALKLAKERRRYGGLTKAEWNRLSPLERRMRSGVFADGYIPNFASLHPDYSKFSWRSNDNSLNPYDRNFMMSTPGLRGLLNPNQSFGRTFANGLIPSLRSSQSRERMQSGRNDVYSRYVDTPKYSGMATFNGSERGMEESIVRNHPNPRRAGATPNFASGTEDVAKLAKVMTNLNIQIASLSEKMAQVKGAGEAVQGQAQISMSPLNVNINHSGRLTAQVEEIQSQISNAVNEAMKQIAPALWRTIKGPATS